MGIGAGIFLIAVGAILAFAVHATVAGVDIHVIGWILMGAGVLGLLMSLLVFAPRRRRTVVQSTSTAVPGPAMGSQPVVDREYREDVV